MANVAPVIRIGGPPAMPATADGRVCMRLLAHCAWAAACAPRHGGRRVCLEPSAQFAPIITALKPQSGTKFAGRAAKRL